MLTDRNVIKLDPANQYKMGTSPVSIAHIDAVTIADGPEPVSVLHLQDENDVVFLMEGENKTGEFVTQLARVAYTVSGKGRAGVDGAPGLRMALQGCGWRRPIMVSHLLLPPYPNQHGRLLRVNVTNNIQFIHGSQRRMTMSRDPNATQPTFVKCPSEWWSCSGRRRRSGVGVALCDARWSVFINVTFSFPPSSRLPADHAVEGRAGHERRRHRGVGRGRLHI